MVSFLTYREDYERLWSSLVIRPSMRAEAEGLAQKLLRGKHDYQLIEARTGVPWWFTGLCHYRESNYNFETYLGNGQPLSRRTTIVPKDRGPFLGADAFLDGAIDAFRLEGFIGAQDWSIARVLYRLEGFNGYGYHAKRVNSPYLWGGSTAYGPPEASAGKYVRDHVFDPAAIDKQCGTAVIFKVLMELDGTIDLAAPRAPDPEGRREADDELADTILWVQQALNRLSTVPPLSEDGRNGPKTMGAVSTFQQKNGLDDTGIADARTIAALQGALQPVIPPRDDGALRARLAGLEQQVAVALRQPQIPTRLAAASQDDDAVVAGLATLRRLASAVAGGGVTGSTSSDPLTPVIQALLRTAAPVPAAASGAALGQVNGALGQTIGTMLDGKKTAIGIVGALLTQVLSQVPAASGLGQVLGLVTPAAGLSPYTLPLFLALAAWGILGKFEKWNQQSVSVPSGNAATPSEPVTLVQ